MFTGGFFLFFHNPWTIIFIHKNSIFNAFASKDFKLNSEDDTI